MHTCHIVPPSPEVTAYLVQEYRVHWKELGLTFRQFLQVSGYGNAAHHITGMDDATRSVIDGGDATLVALPPTTVTGDLHVVVLLVDFPDLEGHLTKAHYETLLFSKQQYLTGSMADYYDEVSRHQVNVMGEVHGWLRMPQPYTYYTNGNSGLTDQYNREQYPRDARKLAEDAVEAALENGVMFPPRLDVLGDGAITALFIVHAGRGAEKLHPLLRRQHIWSHKWHLNQPKWVATNLWATSYLMAPQETLLGVCAHEFGHLAFHWRDVYDPNYDDEGDYWDGHGMWDLMASGAYAGREMRPVHPAGLHKMQQGWIEAIEIDVSQPDVRLKPVTHPDGRVVKIQSSRYQPDQYLLLEYRTREAFDTDLPGDGLLVWRIDESGSEAGRPGMRLIPANGRHHLLNPDDQNRNAPGDPFPGSQHITTLTDTGDVSTSFPDSPASGIALHNITHDSAAQEVRLDIDITTD